MKARSTGSNLIEYINYISKALDRGLEVHAIYTDFSKAFDTVDHTILIAKLKKFGITDSLLHWFESYLSNRTLFVSFNGSVSSKFTTMSGVPQGSVLGPILFNIFINDLSEKLNCNFLLFADDLKIYTTITSIYDCIMLQNDINALFNWCGVNNLKLNIQKCNFMAFTNRIIPLQTNYFIDGEELVKPDSVKDLGVIIDSKLKFDLHIDYIVIKSYRMLGFIMRTTKQFNNSDCIKLLYNALVRSNLEYNTYVWTPFQSNHILKLERIQRNFTRQLAFKFNLFSCPSSRTDFGHHRCPTNRIQRSFTQNFNSVPIENLSQSQFKKKILNLLRMISHT